MSHPWKRSGERWNSCFPDYLMRLLEGMNRATRMPFLLIIRLYQSLVSPLLRPSCIYYPSCSEYARQAFIKHGVLRGMLLSLVRIARCHPFHQGGVDEVPETVSIKTILKNG